MNHLHPNQPKHQTLENSLSKFHENHPKRCYINQRISPGTISPGHLCTETKASGTLKASYCHLGGAERFCQKNVSRNRWVVNVRQDALVFFLNKGVCLLGRFRSLCDLSRCGFLLVSFLGVKGEMIQFLISFIRLETVFLHLDTNCGFVIMHGRV